jgi:NAD(P)-dependent dehydrogenase (short-subunit alcohol dehydrogenase family)
MRDPANDEPRTPRFDMQGDVAFVTGGSRGIGAATAELLAACGASVAVFSRDATEGPELVERLRRRGRTAEWLGCDVTDEAAVRRAFEDASEALGPPTILVNSAGLLERGRAEDTELGTWREVLDVNLTGTFLPSREAARIMRGLGRGVIVNVSSEAGLVGIAGLAAYSAAKAAVVSLTRCMALDLADVGVRVNCVCPGTTRTRMVEDAAAKLPDPDAELRRYASVRPLNRLGAPREIAAAVAFLASPECGYATGSILAVDGGYTA